MKKIGNVHPNSTDPSWSLLTSRFERYQNLPYFNHQPVNSDRMEEAIRNSIQQEQVAERACSGFVCSLAKDSTHCKAMNLPTLNAGMFWHTFRCTQKFESVLIQLVIDLGNFAFLRHIDGAPSVHSGLYRMKSLLLRPKEVRGDLLGC